MILKNKKISKTTKKSQKDPMAMKKIGVITGLRHRYKNRVLIELTLLCPAKCPFCYRKWDRSSKEVNLTKNDISKIIKYIENNSLINEVIISGGEPLIVPDLLNYVLKKISNLKQITVIRIHTRAPIMFPNLVSKKVLSSLSKIDKQALYVSVHVNHVDELSDVAINSIKKLRKAGAIMYSQTVFLKGVNDDVESLKNLFTKLLEIGVRPYNLYKCLFIQGMENFSISLEKEVEIMTKLKDEVSGLAFPPLIVGALGSGTKIPVPLNFWEFNKEFFKDFDGKITRICDIEN